MREKDTSDLRLRAAVESSPSGLLMIDAEGRIVLVNREIERLFGYSREELLGRPVEMLVPERYRGVHPGYRGGFFAAPSVRSMGAGRELYGLRKDGGEVPVEIGLTPVATAEGLFVISSIVDITARKRAEERFRVAVESSPNGVIMTDSEGRIVLVNREIERLFGYGREELLGSSIEKLVPAAARDRHPEYRHGFYAEPRARVMGAGRELYGLRKDGKEVPVEIGLNPIETDEGLLVLSSVVDISARKDANEAQRLLENQLRQAQKLEAVGRLASGIAHDFNNVLASIVGYAELALESTRRSDLEDDIEQLLRASRRGRELVERILRFSRRQDLRLRPIELVPTVVDAARLLRATVPAAVELRLDLDGAPERILADPTSVHQVLMNLITNAVDAMPGGGVVAIGVEEFYVRDSYARAHPGLAEGRFARLTVADSGTGMDEATLARAFEPFYTTKEQGRGSGLGLSMVHAIARDHGGAAGIESREGHGTTAWCLLPIAVEEPEEEIADDEQAIVRGNGERVLVVDDEPSLVEIGRRRLNALGYRATAAWGAEEALSLFRTTPETFDLVLTDYSMPHVNGLELARELSRLRPSTPIVMITGFVDEFGARELAEAGVRAILKKPLTAREMALVLRQVLDAESGGEPS
jgi:PAS domain S-box-containing protein